MFNLVAALDGDIKREAVGPSGFYRALVRWENGTIGMDSIDTLTWDEALTEIGEILAEISLRGTPHENRNGLYAKATHISVFHVTLDVENGSDEAVTDVTEDLILEWRERFQEAA